MSDLFTEKSAEWDGLGLVQQLSAAISSAMLDALTLTPNMQLMDFGAGTGLICSQLAPHVEAITAVDISPSMLKKLTDKPELQGKVSAVCQDLIDTPLNARFDVIVSAMAAHHVKDTHALLGRLFEHLKEGGQLALADLDAEDGSFHPEGIEGVFHDGFDRSTLQALLEAVGFVDVSFSTAFTAIKETGSYPVFLVLGTRPSDVQPL